MPFLLACSLLTYLMIMLFVVVVYPTPSVDGGIAEDHGKKLGDSPRTAGCRETESRQSVSAAKSPWLDSAE